jgi:hypothetical protein
MRFRKGELLEWWQDPAAPSPNTSDTGLHDPATGVSRSYHLELGGTIQTTVEQSPAAHIEDDDIARYDGERSLSKRSPSNTRAVPMTIGSCV